MIPQRKPILHTSKFEIPACVPHGGASHRRAEQFQLKKGVIARSEATQQSLEIASLRPANHVVQGLVRNDSL